MLVIRLFRIGKKNQPSFKIVVTDKRNPPRAGRFVEEVGFYNPVTKEKNLKAEKIKYWMSVGAKPLPTVFNLLVTEKIIEGKKIPVHKKSKKKEETPKEETKPVAPEVKPAVPETAAPETKPAEMPKPTEEKKEEVTSTEGKK